MSFVRVHSKRCYGLLWGCSDCSLLRVPEPLQWAVLGVAVCYHSSGAFRASRQPGLWGQQVRVLWGCLCWYGLISLRCCQLRCGPKQDFWFCAEAVGSCFCTPTYLLVAYVACGYVRNIAIHVRGIKSTRRMTLTCVFEQSSWFCLPVNVVFLSVFW